MKRKTKRKKVAKVDEFEAWLMAYMGTYKVFNTIGSCGYCKLLTARIVLKEYSTNTTLNWRGE